MEKIEIKNIFVSSEETEKSQAFNAVWLRIINLMINK